MSCELVISSNAEEYEITVTGGTTCDEITVTVEIGGEAVPTETDPIFLVSPAGGITSGDIADWDVAYGWGDHSLNHYDATGTVASHLTAFNHGLIQVYETSGGVASHLVAFNHANIHAAHSDDETASTIGTMLGSQGSATPGANDVFPFVQSVGNTLKKITLSNLTTIINSAGIDLTSYLTTGDNISLLVNNSGYITSGELPDYTGDFETSGALSGHLTAFDHSLIDIYETSGEMSGHLTDFDHAGFMDSSDLLDYSTTGHNHNTIYDVLGSATGEVGKHEIDYNHVLITVYDTSGEMAGHLVDYNHAEFQTTLTFGIADTNKVQIDSADVADNEYARFTASGLEGRTAAEVASDIGAATESFAIAMAVALG
jgi:hypothetical protein